MLSSPDRLYIIEEITKVLALEDKPRQTLTSAFVGTNFPILLDDGNIHAMIGHAIRLCEHDGWQHDPMWMELLLTTFALPDSNSRIKQIWERAKIKPPETADPLLSSVLKFDIPFVNRKKFRAQLQKLELEDSNLKPILVVNGKEKSGKSYSTYYIDHFCSIRNNIVSYPITIEPGNELDRGAEEIARDLVLLMGGTIDDIPKPNTNKKRFARELALWVLNKAIRNQTIKHWFVLDNFNMSDNALQSDTRDFLIALSDSITIGVNPRYCRLIIIGFDRALLSVDPGKIYDEFVEPCTPEDLDEAISEITNNISASLSPDGLLKISGFIKNNLPEPKDMMMELNIRLRVLIRAISEVSTIIAGQPEADYEIVLLQMLADLPAGKAAPTVLEERLKRLTESLQEIG